MLDRNQLRQDVERLRKGIRPDYESEARDANRNRGLFGLIRGIVYRDWTTGVLLKDERHAQIEMRLTKLLTHQLAKDAELRVAVDAMIAQKQFPSSIVSEDAAGRFVARIFQLFFRDLSLRVAGNGVNAPVIPYPVGRGTSEKTADIRAKAALKKISQIRNKNVGPVVYVTDSIFTGKSFSAFFRHFLKSVPPEAQEQENRGSLPKLLILSATPADALVSKFPDAQELNGVKAIELTSPSITTNVLRVLELTPISRQIRFRAHQEGESLVPIETREEAGARREIQKRIASKMLEAYISGNEPESVAP